MKNTRALKIIGRLLAYADCPRILVSLMLLFALSSTALTLYMPLLISRAVDLMPGTEGAGLAVPAAILARMAAPAGILALICWLSATRGNHILHQATARIRENADAPFDVPLNCARLLTCVLTFLGSLILMLRISAGTTAAVMLVAPAAPLASAFIVRHTRDMLAPRCAVRDEQTALVNEVICGEKTVQAFGQERACQRRCDEINARLEQTSLRAMFFSSLTNHCARFVSSQVCAYAACLGALSAITGGLTVGQLACFIIYAGLYARCLNEIADLLANLQDASIEIPDIGNAHESDPETADSSAEINQ